MIDPLVQQLVARRIALGISQRDVANELLVSQTCVWYWENGKRRMSTRSAWLYADVVGGELALVGKGHAP